MCGDNLLLAFIIPYFFYVYKLVVYFVKNLTHSVSYTLHIHKHCEILNQLRETAEKQKKKYRSFGRGTLQNSCRLRSTTAKKWQYIIVPLP